MGRDGQSRAETGDAVFRYGMQHRGDGSAWTLCHCPHMPRFEELEAWKRSHELALAVYGATKAFPKSELYGLTSQTRRAAFSVPANLVEGLAKRGMKELRRYLDISLGSMAELRYALMFARDAGLLAQERWQELEELRRRAGYLLWRLYRSVG